MSAFRIGIFMKSVMLSEVLSSHGLIGQNIYNNDTSIK